MAVEEQMRKCQVGWLVGFINVALELHYGLLATIWETLLRVIRRHAITIWILHGGGGSPALVVREEMSGCGGRIVNMEGSGRRTVEMGC